MSGHFVLTLLFSSTMSEATVYLKPNREKSIQRGHPWIFSGAIHRTEGDLTPGCTVRVIARDGTYAATGAYSPESNIRVRIWTRDEAETVDRAFFRRKIDAAVQARESLGLLDAANTACRLIFAESDGLPGLIADRYNDFLVLQFLSAGPEAWKQVIAEEMAAATEIANIYERSDVEVRQLEGYKTVTGSLLGETPPGPLTILEDGMKFHVDILEGHKTGFYLDQRFNRAGVRRLSSSKEVLNCFAYTGGFSIAALTGGAKHVLSIEASAAAIAQGKVNLTENGFSDAQYDWIEGDVFVELRGLRDRNRSFDMIILDPPKFAATRNQAQSAARGYKDINLLAFKLLRPGGILVTFSCSGGIDADFFQKIVAGAALDAGCDAQIIDRLTQAPDHPSALHFPESQYLKGLVIRKVG